MKKSKFSEEKTISIIREGDAGAKVADLCRKHGMSDVSYYKWKAKFAGMVLKNERVTDGAARLDMEIREIKKTMPVSFMLRLRLVARRYR